MQFYQEVDILIDRQYQQAGSSAHYGAGNTMMAIPASIFILYLNQAAAHFIVSFFPAIVAADDQRFAGH